MSNMFTNHRGERPMMDKIMHVRAQHQTCHAEDNNLLILNKLKPGEEYFACAVYLFSL